MPCPIISLASAIRHRSRYCIGGRPTTSQNRCANTEREAPEEEIATQEGPRTIFRVPVAIADLLAQIVLHNTTTAIMRLLQAVTQTFCHCGDFGKQNRRCDAVTMLVAGISPNEVGSGAPYRRVYDLARRVVVTKTRS